MIAEGGRNALEKIAEEFNGNWVLFSLDEDNDFTGLSCVEVGEGKSLTSYYIGEAKIFIQ